MQKATTHYFRFRSAQPKVTNFPFNTIVAERVHKKCSHFERGPRNLIISLFDRAFIVYTTYNTTLQPSAIRTYMLSVQFSDFTDIKFYRKFKGDKYKVLGRNDYEWPAFILISNRD